MNEERGEPDDMEKESQQRAEYQAGDTAPSEQPTGSDTTTGAGTDEGGVRDAYTPEEATDEERARYAELVNSGMSNQDAAEQVWPDEEQAQTGRDEPQNG